MGYKCCGNGIIPCPDNKSGAGVKKISENIWRCDSCQQNTTVSNDVTNPGTDELVINELLCFVTNFADTMSPDDMKQICTNFYKPNEVTEAYEKLLSFCSPDDKSASNNDPGKDECMLIIKLTQNKKSTLPVFLAKNLARLPSVRQDKIDVMSLFKDMSILRNKLDRLERTTTSDINKVREEVRKMNVQNKSTDKQSSKANESMRPSSPPPPRHQPRVGHVSDANPQTDTDSGTDAETGTTRKVTVTDTPTVASKPWSDDDPDLIETDNSQNPWQTVNRKPRRKPQMSSSNARPSTRVVGTGSSRTGLSASSYEPPVSLFVSFLPPETTPSQIDNYIKRNIGCDYVEVEKLSHKFYDDFASFKVTTKKKFVDALRNPTIWPKNIVIDFYRAPRRRFYRRQNIRQYESKDYRNDGDYYNDYTDYHGNHRNDRTRYDDEY